MTSKTDLTKKDVYACIVTYACHVGCYRCCLLLMLYITRILHRSHLASGSTSSHCLYAMAPGRLVLSPHVPTPPGQQGLQGRKAAPVRPLVMPLPPWVGTPG